MSCSRDRKHTGTCPDPAASGTVGQTHECTTIPTIGRLAWNEMPFSTQNRVVARVLELGLQVVGTTRHKVHTYMRGNSYYFNP